MDEISGPLETRDATAQSASAAVGHPLQDVDLGLTETLPETNTKTVAKNWVKFDDEVDGEVIRRDNNNSKHVIDGAPRSIVATEVGAAAEPTAATTPNKLSPPPRKKPIATTTPTPAAMSTNTNAVAPVEKLMNKHAAAVAPVQRSTVTSSTTEAEVAPAVLATESTHVNLNASSKTQQQQQQQHQQQLQHQHQQPLQQQQQHQQQQQSKLKPSSALSSGVPTAASSPALHGRQHTNNGASGNKSQSITIPVESTPPMRTIELSTGRIREGFANGDVIVTLLPANTKWPWITPAIFRPELVPEELMAQGLTLTVEDYVHAMETLVNDYRFTVYNICYKRILVCWILFAFGVLLTLLFSGLKGVALFSLGVGWLFLNAAAIFLCMWVKLRLARGLEKCLARVNKQLMRHNILLILDDRGRISCHKVNLCFLYFDAAQCVNFLNEFLEHTEQNGGEAIKAGWEAKLDLDLNDIVIQGNNPVRLSRKQAVAQEIFLSYLQRWGKDFLRRRLDWTVQEAGVHEAPRHLQSSICPCQYEEELLRNKIKTHLQRKQCCGINCLACWL